MPTGDSLAYVSGTTHIALPKGDGLGYRAAHKPAAKKPTGLDWDAITPTCRDCGTKSGQVDATNGLCPKCRGETTTKNTSAKPERGRDTGYQPLPAEDLETRFNAPDQPPAHDATRLGRDLAELEATDPAVAASADSLEDTIERITRAGDRVIPANLDPEPQPVTTGTQCIDLDLNLQAAHTDRVLRRSIDTSDPIVGILRSSVLATIEALHLYLELHHPASRSTQTPAASVPPAGAAGQTTEPSSLGLGGERPAADSQGEGERQPANFQTHQRPARRRPAPRGDIDEQAVVREYRAGGTPPELSHRHGCGAKRIRSILDRHGVERRDDRATRSGGKPIQHDQDTIDTVVRLYRDEERSISAIEVQVGIEKRQVARILRNAGVGLRPSVSAELKPIDDTTRGELIRRYLAGDTLATLAKDHHLRAERIRSVITDAGHPLRTRGGPQTGIAERLAALGVTTAQVKAWAHTRGLIPEIPRGVVQTRLIDAYETAHPTTRGDTHP